MEGRTVIPLVGNREEEIEIRMKLRVFSVPPINDALVLGRQAPIGGEAWRRALALLQSTPFESIKLDDEVIEEILIQKRILKKITKEGLIKIILNKIKPFMSAEEVIHLDIEVELSLIEKL